MKLNKLQRTKLEKKFGNVVFESFKNDPVGDNWVAAGKPRIFIPVEQKDDYLVVMDYGYGGIILFRGDIICGTGKNSITPWEDSPHKVIVLNKEYYDLDKYIWE